MGRCILIVEDNPLNMKLFRDLLRFKGYETLEATDGQQGVDCAKEHKPDLILMDIMLPGINGIEAIQLIKDDPDTCQIPVIALASFALPDEKDRVFKAGGDAYIMKPVNIKALVAKINKFLRASAVST
jgi:two-component system cell cycle response regulator DivK